MITFMVYMKMLKYKGKQICILWLKCVQNGCKTIWNCHKTSKGMNNHPLIFAPISAFKDQVIIILLLHIVLRSGVFNEINFLIFFFISMLCTTMPQTLMILSKFSTIGNSEHVFSGCEFYSWHIFLSCSEKQEHDMPIRHKVTNYSPR